jgi:hypothetical protein
MEAINQNNSSQTLFRFATMRNAELSDPKNKERRFIFRDYDTQKGLIDKRVELGESLQRVCETPTDLIIKTETSLKEQDPAFYELAVWVARNKANATKAEFDKKIDDYKTLQHQDILIDSKIWDNLIYQVVTQKDFYAKETLMQFLHLDHILLNYNGSDEDQYEDVIRAKVVLPKELFKVNHPTSANGSVSKREENSQIIPYDDTDMNFAEATINLKANRELSSAMEKLEKSYYKEYEEAYKTTYNRYVEGVRPIQAEYQSLVSEQEHQKEMFLATENKEGFSNLKYIPVPEIPKFTFEFRPEIQRDDLLKNLDQENILALYRVVGASDSATALTGISTFAEISEAIAKSNQILEQTVLNNTVLNKQVSTTVGGVVVPVTNSVSNVEVIPFFARTMYLSWYAHTMLKDMKIADVSMTAEWELALQKIENVEMDTEIFQKEMKTYVSSLTQELLQACVGQNSLPQLMCPKCKNRHLIIRDIFIKCPDEMCQWIQYRKVCGIHLGIPDIESLLNNGRTSLIRGMKSKSGKKFDAYFILNDKGESSFKFH